MGVYKVWRKIETAPWGKEVLLFGKSGYGNPHDTFIINGFRLLNWHNGEWNDATGSHLSENGWAPTHWTDKPEVPGKEQMMGIYKVGKESMDKIMDSTISLLRSCTRVHGNTPDLNMTLRDFIMEYGPNGVVFGLIGDFQKVPPQTDTSADWLLAALRGINKLVAGNTMSGGQPWSDFSRQVQQIASAALSNYESKHHDVPTKMVSTVYPEEPAAVSLESALAGPVPLENLSPPKGVGAKCSMPLKGKRK